MGALGRCERCVFAGSFALSIAAGKIALTLDDAAAISSARVSVPVATTTFTASFFPPLYAGPIAVKDTLGVANSKRATIMRYLPNSRLLLADALSSVTRSAGVVKSSPLTLVAFDVCLSRS
jgi:hypothetical protein